MTHKERIVEALRIQNIKPARVVQGACGTVEVIRYFTRRSELRASKWKQEVMGALRYAGLKFEAEWFTREPYDGDNTEVVAVRLKEKDRS